MNNPTKEGMYTTVFRDGSIIYDNPWMIFPDGHGKWYWNEQIRGGVVGWFEMPEGGYGLHKFYRLPDWELCELLEDQHILHALADSNAYTINAYKQAMIDYLKVLDCASFAEVVQNDLNTYYSGYECE